MDWLITDAEKALVDEISRLGQRATTLTAGRPFLFESPEGVSSLIWRRLWSHNQAYLMLWKAEFTLEADTILRGVIECAICLAANEALRQEFYPLLLADLVTTLKKQLRDFPEEAAAIHQLLRALKDRAAPGEGVLNWKRLAEAGGQEFFYSLHQRLSATAAHVASYSVMRSINSDEAGFWLRRRTHVIR